MNVTIVGIGMGMPDSLTVQAADAICEATVLIGAKRMLDSAVDILADIGQEPPICIKAISATQIAAVLADEVPDDRLKGVDMRQVCVVCSGDTGFYSLATSLIAKLEELQIPCGVTVLPGLTTVQVLASRLGRSWQNCKLASAHGRDCDALGLVLENEDLFLLTGGDQTPMTIISLLNEVGLGDVEVTVAERLSYPDETITTATAAELAGREFNSLASMWIRHGQLCDDAVKGYVGFSGIPDDCFIRGDAPMTKAEVRGFITSRLHPAAGEVVYDIGAGTGSTSIETASLQHFARVYAIEKEEAACALIEQNRMHFGAYNLSVVPGRAPDALDGLPAPDAVFVGGSTGNLEQILDAVLEANPAARILVSAVTMETVAQTSSLLTSLEQAKRIGSFSATQLAATRTKMLGHYHMLRPESPVFIFEATGIGA